MANDHTAPFEKQVNNEALFKSDLLSDLDRTRWPDRIDYVASQVATGDYTIGIQSSSPVSLSGGRELEKVARNYYLSGIAALTGDHSRRTALPDDFRLGQLLVEFARLRNGLEEVDRRDVSPGEILSRLIMRTVKRQSSGQQSQLARQLRADTETPRELVTELTTVPEIAPMVESALPEADNPARLTTELASLDLTTELWDHQFESLALWLYHGMNGYVDMATATGKTVLGLAAVAHAVDSGSLHPADRQRLESFFDGELPEPQRNRPDDVLIVTTDDLLGVQWARLFQEHCHTPPEFTNVGETGIQLPWGQIDIRSAGSLGDVKPADYRLAVFDEVHNYSARSGWGDHLVEFVESACPVLALTGSATDDLESLIDRVDRSFLPVYRYTHELALADGVIPDFEWTLTFTDVTESDALSQFRETAEQFDRLVEYDAGTYRLDPDSLTEVEPELTDSELTEIAGEYLSGSSLAKGLRKVGEDGTAPRDALELLASGVGNRTIHRLNLRAELDSVVETAESALSERRPVLVLTQSYGEAKEIWQALYDRHDDRLVTRLEADESAAEHDETIQAFDGADTDEKVLIGPGNRIGQGNDIKSVEVGINIARPGTGVNATLVQRLGRLLRDAGGKETVEFYHVVGVPPANATIEPDGESFVRTVAEFFGQVLEPDADGILKPPSVSIREVESDVVELEQQGAANVLSDDQSTIIESTYATAIEEQTGNERPAVKTDWFSAAFGDEAQPTVGNSNDGRVETRSDDDKAEKDMSETGESHETEEQGDSESDPETGDIDRRSPLAEYNDAFRSLGIIHKALQKSAGSEIPESDPFRRWMEDIQSIVSEAGYGDQKTGYGKQQASRSPLSMTEYREAFGTGERVTEFEVISVCNLSEAVMALLSESLSDLSSWVVPIAPESDVPLPVVVESEAELARGRSLLGEFPAEPPVFPEEDAEDAEEIQNNREVSSTSEEEETKEPEEQSTTPVEEVRGVSDSIGEALRAAGYERLRDLQTASDGDLAAVEGLSEHRVQLIRAIVGSK